MPVTGVCSPTPCVVSVAVTIEVEVLSPLISVDMTAVSDMESTLVMDIMVFAESVADGSAPRPEPQANFQEAILSFSLE